MNVDGSMTRSVADLAVGITPVQSQDPGRLCRAPDCITRLSRYNPDGLCTAHGGWTDATVKRPGRKPQGEGEMQAVS